MSLHLILGWSYLLYALAYGGTLLAGGAYVLSFVLGINQIIPVYLCIFLKIFLEIFHLRSLLAGGAYGLSFVLGINQIITVFQVL